jgi:hypothetical protein
MTLTYPEAGDVIFVLNSVKAIALYQKQMVHGSRPEITHAAIVADHDHLIEAQAVGKKADGVRMTTGTSSFSSIYDWKQSRSENEEQFAVLRRSTGLTTEESVAVARAANYFNGAEYALTELLQGRPTPDGRAVCSGLVAKILNTAQVLEIGHILKEREPFPSELYDLLIKSNYELIDLKNYWPEKRNANLSTVSLLAFLVDMDARNWELEKMRLQLDSSWHNIWKFAFEAIEQASAKQLFSNFRRETGRSAIVFVFDQLVLLWNSNLHCLDRTNELSAPNFSQADELSSMRKELADELRNIHLITHSYVSKFIELTVSCLDTAALNVEVDHQRNSPDVELSGMFKVVRSFVELSYCFHVATDYSPEVFVPGLHLPKLDLKFEIGGVDLSKNAQKLGPLRALLTETASALTKAVLAMQFTAKALRSDLLGVNREILEKLELNVTEQYLRDVTKTNDA